MEDRVTTQEAPAGFYGTGMNQVFSTVGTAQTIQSSTSTSQASTTLNIRVAPPNTPGSAVDELHTYLSSLANSKTKKAAATEIKYSNPYSFNLGSSVNGDRGTLSATQLALHNYGNKVGAVIQEVTTHTDETNAAFDAFFKNPSDTTEAGVEVAAKRFNDLAQKLRAISDIPESLKGKTSALIAGYENVGASLKSLGTLRDSSEILSAVENYAATSATAGNAFVELVSAFKDAGVVFGTDESGSVFSFSYEN